MAFLEEVLAAGMRSEFSGRVRDGEGFRLNRTVLSLAQNARSEIHIRVGARPLMLSVSPAISQNGLFEVTEAPTLSASGTSLLPVARNRRTRKTPGSTFWHTPTVSASGTILASNFLPGGTGGSAQGFLGQSQEDWLLEPGSGYLLSLGNLAATAAVVTLAANFFELASGEV
jgi:hypothetical protein